MRHEAIRRPTVMLIGTDHPVIRAVLGGLGAQSARIVLVDANAWSSRRLSTSVGGEINVLNLDVLRRDHCDAVARYWEDEPLDLLLHFQALHHQGRPRSVLRSIVRMTQALSPGLQAADGGCYYFWSDSFNASSDQGDALFFRLGPTLERAFGPGSVPISGLRLQDTKAADDLSPALLRFLTRIL